MRVYAIRDLTTGAMWSRNRWANHDAAPDLYKDQNRAFDQITKYKISLMLKNWPSLRPVVIAYDLVEVETVDKP